MSQRIDLDAARAARREAEQQAPSVVLDGEEFVLPIEMPFEIASDLGRLLNAKDDAQQLAAIAGEVVPKIVEGLLGDEYERFMSHRPSFEDLTAFLDGIAGAYGLGNVGESSASA